MRSNRHPGENGAAAAPGLPASFASETARLAITGQPEPDAPTRRLEWSIVILVVVAYGAALIACALVLGSGWLERVTGLHFPDWAILVLACIALSALLRAGFHRYADRRRKPVQPGSRKC